jgi:3,5-epimerase/4-reductase
MSFIDNINNNNNNTNNASKESVPDDNKTATSSSVEAPRSLRWLIYGGRGWIGQQVCSILSDTRPHDKVVIGAVRADNFKQVREEMIKAQPDRVLSLIGRTHGPGYSTIDYLEQRGKLKDNVCDNLLAPITLWSACHELGIHFTYLGTGCIFKYDTGKHCLDDDSPSAEFTEDDEPNFFGSSYSVIKGATDRLLHLPPFAQSCLNARIRMPITADYHPRNFLTKILSYDRICSIPNSMSVLPELLPVLVDLAVRKITGTVNLTNPGRISHNRILELYKSIVDPDFEWQNFSETEQNEILAAERSNNALSTDRLQQLSSNVQPIEQAVISVLTQLQAKYCKFVRASKTVTSIKVQEQ